jgi:hypothetical protein
MNIEKFEQDLKKIQERFNRTFGIQSNCDIATRSLVIMSIANMGVIIKRIKRNSNHAETMNQIMLLKRMGNVINRTFDQVEKFNSERGTYESRIKIAM